MWKWLGMWTGELISKSNRKEQGRVVAFFGPLGYWNYAPSEEATLILNKGPQTGVLYLK